MTQDCGAEETTFDTAVVDGEEWLLPGSCDTWKFSFA